MIPMWAACEVTLGYANTGYHNPVDCVERVREELPWEHSKGRHTEFSVAAFEEALAKHCPDCVGDTDAWYQVFLTVPTKILTNESFFG